MRLHYLATWWDVLKVCRDEQRFDAATLTEVERFLNNPIAWSSAHGGISELP
jgi:orotate phosphoribosyltransferase